jgi:hypothetical protein
VARRVAPAQRGLFAAELREYCLQQRLRLFRSSAGL